MRVQIQHKGYINSDIKLNIPWVNEDVLYIGSPDV